MQVVKRIVCLANSRKLSGRCIAGKEVDSSGAWIRPVSDRPTEEVSEHERQYEDGSDPRLLDIIDVPLLHSVPKAYQTENWLLDSKQYWKRSGQASWNDLQQRVDDPPTLWSNDHHTFHGVNDRIPVAEADSLPGSLYFLRLESLELHVFPPGERFGNPKRRAHAAFSYREVPYRLWVSDPVIERDCLARPDGRYPVGCCYVTVSLGEPHDGYCYKLVAAVITPPQAGRQG